MILLLARGGANLTQKDKSEDLLNRSAQSASHALYSFSLLRWHPSGGPGRAFRCRGVSIFTVSPGSKKEMGYTL